MSTRKEKAAKKKAARLESAMEFDFEPITPEINVPNPIPENIPDINDSIVFQNGRIDPAVVTAESNGVKPIVGKAFVANPKGLATAETSDVTDTEDKPADIPEAEKPKTLADYIAERRKQIEDEKTSSVKMQKYYALTDALKALADLGGSAVGGAIGGNMLDSAPDVGKYQPNRFYLEALEKSKKANERLRALDEKEYQLALRDEERSYQQQLKKVDRDFQMRLAKYNAELKRAEAEANHERAKELRELMAELQLERETKIATIKGKQALAEKQIAKEMVAMQMNGKKKTKSIWFDDGSEVEMDNDDFDALKRSLLGKRINGTLVDKNNIDRVISANPSEINSILKLYGIGSTAPEKSAAPAANTAQQVNRIIGINDGSYPYYQYLGNQPANYVEATDDTGFDISAYKRK